MYVTIRKYARCGDAKEINRIAQAEILPLLRKVPGFRFYTTVDAGSHVVVSISTFDSKASAEAANVAARGVVQKSMAKLLPNPPDVTVGEVLADVSA